jgi:hypothetical protein
MQTVSYDYPPGSFGPVALPDHCAAIMFAFSTGDTFNGLLQLAKAPPQIEYHLIVKKPQLELLQALLNLLPAKPTVVHVFDHFDNHFTKLIRDANPHLTTRGYGYFPAIREPGLYNWGHAAFEDRRVNKLGAADIAQIRAHFVSLPKTKEIPDGTVVLFPNMGAGRLEDDFPWGDLARHIMRGGRHNVVCNVSGKAEYANETIPGVEPLQLSQLDLLANFYQKGERLRFVAARSGVVDLIRLSASRGIVLYPDKPIWRQYSYFDTYRIGQMFHNLDLAEVPLLASMRGNWLDLVSYYCDNFLCSSIPDDVFAPVA